MQMPPRSFIKHILKRAIFCGAFCSFLTEPLAAQESRTIFLRDGRAVSETQYVDVKGSPYLLNDWAKGEAVFDNNKRSGVLDFKFDEAANKLYYKGENGQPYMFSQQVVEFYLDSAAGKTTDSLLRFKLGSSLGMDKPGLFYQILYDGKTKFIKLTTKNIVKQTVYGSANDNRVVQEKKSYYITDKKTGELTKIKLSNKDIYKALAIDNARVSTLDPDGKINYKEEADVVYFLSLIDTK